MLLQIISFVIKWKVSLVIVNMIIWEYNIVVQTIWEYSILVQDEINGPCFVRPVHYLLWL